MSDRSSPLVSVILPVYNGEPYLAEAIESILDQTLAAWELIAIDDGSQDDSWQILTAYAGRDERLVVRQNEQNRGLIRTLNRGLSLARGEYIARQDQDDRSLPSRLSRQVAYLERHPQVGVLATAYYRLFANGELDERQPPQTHTAIRWRLLFGNVLCHPSVMFRRRLYEQGLLVYREGAAHAEDYDLWAQAAPHTQIATLPVPLVIYRDHESTTDRISQVDIVSEVSNRQLRALLPDRSVTEAELIALRRCYNAPRLSTPEFRLCPLILQLFEVFGRQPDIDPRLLKHLRRNWIKRRLATASPAQWPVLISSGLLGSILRHDPVSLLLAVGVHMPRRMLRGDRFLRLRSKQGGAKS